MGKSTSLTVEILKDIVGPIIKEVAKRSLPGKDKKQIVVDLLIKKLEEYDNALPAIGAYLDSDTADRIEKALVGAVVQRAYDELYSG